MKKIFLVTLTYNSSKETHDFLSSVAKLRHDGFEIHVVVVDNASTDPFILNKDEKKQPITLIRQGENKGFAGGNNIGIHYALENGAEYVVIVNNDTLLDEKLVAYLLDAIEMHPEVGIAVPKMYFAKGHEFHKDRYKKEEQGRVLWYAGGFTDWANVFSVHRGVDEVDHGQYDKEELVTFASGCCMMMPRKVLEKVGVFDENFFLYFEDADLNERVQRAGEKVLYVPKAKLWHINAGSTGGSGSMLQDYFQSRNRMLFGMRYAPFKSKVALLRESIRLLISGRIMQRKGILDFYVRRFGKGSYFQ